MDRDFVERVRGAISDTFGSQGYPPSRDQIRELAAVDDDQVDWQLTISLGTPVFVPPNSRGSQSRSTAAPGDVLGVFEQRDRDGGVV